MHLRGIYFDFGFVFGYPRPGIDRKYFYLDWDGLGPLLGDELLAPYWRTGIGLQELEAFFKKELYDVFIEHEIGDLIAPQVPELLQQKLPLLCHPPIPPSCIDRIFFHINTMKYIDIDAAAILALKELSQYDLCLSMISNMMLPGKLLMDKLRESDMLRYLNTVTISSDIGFIKPHREIFMRTLQKDHLQPDEVLFVGDTYNQDIRGAKSVGMRTCWLNSRNEPKALATAGPPDYELETLSALVDLVGTMRM